MKLKDLEKELIGDTDAYDQEVKEKFERKLLVGNLLESSSQARISKVGGEMLSAQS
jgi:hypothetical protein